MTTKDDLVDCPFCHRRMTQAVYAVKRKIKSDNARASLEKATLKTYPDTTGEIFDADDFFTRSGGRVIKTDYCEHRFPPEGRACIDCGVLYGSIHKATTAARDAACESSPRIRDIRCLNERGLYRAGFKDGYDQGLAARDEEVKQLHAELERKEKLCHEMWVNTMDRDWPVVKLNQEITRLREALERIMNAHATNSETIRGIAAAAVQKGKSDE